MAILFWLKAIKEIKEDRFIISPFIELILTFLDHMDKADLFTFAAFLQHETLTEHHAMIFHQGLQSSKLQLSRLEKMASSFSAAGYQIHHLLHRPVVKTSTA